MRVAAYGIFEAGKDQFRRRREFDGAECPIGVSKVCLESVSERQCLGIDSGPDTRSDVVLCHLLLGRIAVGHDQAVQAARAE